MFFSVAFFPISIKLATCKRQKFAHYFVFHRHKLFFFAEEIIIRTRLHQALARPRRTFLRSARWRHTFRFIASTLYACLCCGRPRPCTPALCRLNPCSVRGTCEMIANMPTLDKSLKQQQPPLGCNWEMPIAACNTYGFIVDVFSTFQFTRNFSPILYCWIYMQMKTVRPE